MSRPTPVRGQSCLAYVDKPIGFGNIRGRVDNTLIWDEQGTLFNMYVRGEYGVSGLFNRSTSIRPTLWKCSHDTNKRIAGLVLDNFSDGGIKIAIMGNENLSPSEVAMYNVSASCFLAYDSTLGGNVHKDAYDFTPHYKSVTADHSGTNGMVRDELRSEEVSFDDIIDFYPNFGQCELRDVWGSQALTFKYRGNDITGNTPNSFALTRDKDNTLTYGENEIQSTATRLYGSADSQNPLELMGGNLYAYLEYISGSFYALCPETFLTLAYLEHYTVSAGQPANTMNCVCIPYNLILFNNEYELNAYLDSGVVSENAYLFPLDFDNLPKYSVPDDTPDNPDDNISDDDIRDITPNLPVAPTFTPQKLSNNNYYWITLPELRDFMNWFWNDIGNVTDFSDLIAKIEGLYNNLSQAILNIRYMPIDNEATWIGGKGTPSNIKIAQIEKNGNVDTIGQGNPIVREIAHIPVPDKYHSFVDLSPYSQLSLYLPYHGFLDLDMNIFSGHAIDIKAVYDFISGTIQYFIYYDNTFMVNSVVCKMAMDIPISLQTKNDRDSAIFTNVSNVVGGLMGAGLSLGTGNPMGLLIGANTLNSGIATAPLNVKGNVGEQGAFYAPPQCAIILRRPTISKPSQDIWKARVGQICGKSHVLSTLSGYTTVYNPQIDFTGNKNNDNVVMKPLESEVKEIYDLLEEGVIL